MHHYACGHHANFLSVTIKIWTNVSLSKIAPRTDLSMTVTGRSGSGRLGSGRSGSGDWGAEDWGAEVTFSFGNGNEFIILNLC